VVDLQRLDVQIDRIQDGEDLDNCPFVENPEQEDVDQDAFGDICDPDDSEPEESDTDGDGIVDKEDACPDIPENINGTEDKD
jgi:hypothetical protein